MTAEPNPEKLYCYVDETGQDTQGDLFIVAVVLAGADRDSLLRVCEEIERATGKGQVKWRKTRYERRLAYIRRILQTPAFKGKLTFTIYRDSRDYLALTTQAIAAAIHALESRADRVTVLFDGLPRSQERRVGARLRRMRIPVRKVRGVRRDENDALIRLADALCGFVRAATEGQKVMQDLFERAKKQGYLTEVGGQ